MSRLNTAMKMASVIASASDTYKVEESGDFTIKNNSNELQQWAESKQMYTDLKFYLNEVQHGRCTVEQAKAAMLSNSNNQ